MKKLKYILSAALASAMFLQSCDLDEYPKMETTGNEVYSSEEGYKQALAKIYAAYVIRGNEEGGGNADLKEEDPYYCSRSCFNLQECGTDEIMFTWAVSDELLEISQLKNLNGQSKWIHGAYYSLYYIVTLANDFIRNCSDEGETGKMKNEARFMRAFAYSQIMDFWPVGAFVTEKDPSGAYEPSIATRSEMCDYVISELKDLTEVLPETNEQYRANKYAAAALLSRVLLNANVYKGSDDKQYYSDCIKYSEMVINGGYSLENDFYKLFNADNYKRTNEIIFSFYTGKDGSNGDKGYGSTTMIISGSGNQADDGSKANLIDVLGLGDANNAWQLFRARKQAAQRFEAGDKRDLFFKDGRSVDNPTPFESKEAGEGYVFNKFCNTTDDGKVAGDYSNDLSQVDLPVLRLSEVILNEAEAILRGGAGATRSAVQLVNQVRSRAGVSDFSAADLDATTNGVQFWNLLEERGREFMLESLRRTDLIRFDAYAGPEVQYEWEWKGGVLSGTTAEAKYKFFPLPVNELSANSALYDPYYN